MSVHYFCCFSFGLQQSIQNLYSSDELNLNKSNECAIDSILYFCNMQSLLIIGYVWPEPTATAAGTRMLQIIEQFLVSGYKITFASPAHRPTTAFDLSEIGVVEQEIKLNDSSFDCFIDALDPYVVLFDRFMMEEQFGWRVAEICPSALRILDSEDLHFLRKARHQAIKKGDVLPTEIIHSDEAMREIASIYRCDVTFTISEFEMKYLKEIFGIPEDLLWYLPFLVEISDRPTLDFEERQDFLFIGNFIHKPNWDAVLQLKHHVWPLLRKKLPEAKLHVYGAYSSEKVFQLHHTKENFLVHGRAEEVSEVMEKARVCLAPIRFGAGLKGKLIDAMKSHTPFVTSPIGAEGMFGEIDLEVSIADHLEDFVSKSEALYLDKDLWVETTKRGEEVLRSRFDKNIIQKDFGDKLKMAKEQLEARRFKNFVGGMLQHHTMKSTKYLSKWITEKNKS